MNREGGPKREMTLREVFSFLGGGAGEVQRKQVGGEDSYFPGRGGHKGRRGIISCRIQVTYDSRSFEV